MTDDSQRIREAIAVHDSWRKMIEGRYPDAYETSDSLRNSTVLADAARRLVDGELPPGFPTEADAMTAARAYFNYTDPSMADWDTLPLVLREDRAREMMVALEAVAESRLSAPAEPEGEEN